MKKNKTIHFVGIKGVGMTPLALIAKGAGFDVTGSDIVEEFITDAALKKAGITPFVGFATEHILKPDLVITTGAHGGYDNPEVKEAKSRGIEVISAGEAVGVFMDGKILGKKYKGVSVAGTHGKTTTTAMLATILRESGYDPSFVIGTGNVSSLGVAGYFGKGAFFIAEADEYATEPKHDKTPKFLWQHPSIAIITNIEFDHPDVYSSLEDVKAAFGKLCAQLSKDGIIIACGDDHEVKNVVKGLEKKVITYGFNSENNYVLERVHVSGEQTFFWVKGYGTNLGEFVLRVAGEHNALNALASIIACLEIGVPLDKVRKALPAFRGSQRRLEFIGDLQTGAKVYDDYAHHPTEIKKTLFALHQQYPNKKIVCIFQPHTYSRTKILFNEFIGAFDMANNIVITDIYASLREKIDLSISSQVLAEAIKVYHRGVIYLPQLSDVVQYVDQNKFRTDTIVVTMGAGDIYKIHSQLKFYD